MALSDALGVSSAPNLGGHDMTKLLHIIEDPSSFEHILRALQRLTTAQYQYT